MEYTQDELEFMLGAALAQSDAYPKALANFLFREVIEDAHTKYNISQEDMKDMCKKNCKQSCLVYSVTA